MKDFIKPQKEKQECSSQKENFRHQGENLAFSTNGQAFIYDAKANSNDTLFH